MNKPVSAEKTLILQTESLMTEFAERTGLTSNKPPVRYLWTDAFAVCNFLGLAQETKNDHYTHLARCLIEQVHEILGRHRKDDSRTGWISSLSEDEGRRHPTFGGLRIGKPLPERGPDDPFDERLEWERDGQYFHYLTKWMHALDVIARHSRESRYADWSRELAEAAANAFIHRNGSEPRMCWKMNTDLSRPLVSSMGHHDPLDGYVTTLQLRATAEALKTAVNDKTTGSHKSRVLDNPLQSFDEMVKGRNWQTTDPLGLGGLLADAVRLTQLIRQGGSADIRLLKKLLRDAHSGLGLWAQSWTPDQPAYRRLAFRELGLVIGLQGVSLMRENIIADAELQNCLDALNDALPLIDAILSFWIAPGNQQSPTWTEHQDINAVMLATASLPEGFLILPSVS